VSPTGPRLLLVEDNPLEAEVVQRILGRAEAGYRITRTSTLRQTLAQDEEEFDAILLDLVLPDSSGMETVRQVVARFPGKPIVVMSSRDEVGIAERSLEEGAQDYLVKGKADWSLVLRSLRYAILRNQNVDALRQREAISRELIDRSADGIIVLDAEGSIRFANPAASRLAGREVDDLIGRQFGFPAFAGGVSELDLIHSNGHAVLVEMRVSSITWGTESVLVSLRDITERARLDRERMSNTAMLQRLADVLVGVQACRTVGELLDKIAQGACELAGAESGVAVLDECAGMEPAYGSYPREEAVEAGRVDQLVEQLRAEARPVLGVEAGRLVFPLSGGERGLLGFLRLQLAPSTGFAVSELRALRQFSQVSALAIEHIILLGELAATGARLKQENDQLSALSDISTLVVTTLDVNALLSTAAQRVRQALRADVCAILQTGRDGTLYGIRDRDGEGVLSLQSPELPSLVAAREAAQPVLVNDPGDSFQQVLGDSIQTAAVCQLEQEGALLGYLCLGWRRTSTCGERELTLLGAAAARCSLGIHAAFLRQKQEEALESLRVANEFTTAMINSAPVGILALDPGGSITLWNVAAERMFGWSARELAGNLAPFATGDAAENFARLLVRVRDGAPVTGMECLLSRADGSPLYVSLSAAPLSNAGSQSAGVVVMIDDITGRKQAERALRRSQRRLARAHQMALLGDWETNLVDGQTDWSDEVLGIFGLPAGGNLTNATLALVLPEDRARVEHSRRHTLATRQPYDIEYRIVRPDGGQRWIREHAEVRLSGTGQATVLAGTIQDVTAYKRLEQEFLQAQKMESIGRLAGGVAHGFNNHLTVINGYCDLLLSRLAADDPARDRILAIREAGERATVLTRQLLTFSRKQVMRPQVVAVNDTVGDLLRMLRGLLGEDYVIETHLEEGLAPVLADPGQLSQVVMNLVLNARDAMPGGGCIVLRTRSTVGKASGQPLVCLSVEDRGVGLSEEQQRRAFEPFFTTKPGGMGTGLGLSTAYGIVTAAGGWLEIDSKPGQGAKFHVFLPASPGNLAPALDTPAPDLSLEGSETILIVEDQEGVRQLTAELLDRFGYTVVSAPDAEHAVELLTRNNGAIDMVLTDIVMPGMKGPELADIVHERWLGVKVGFMSAYPEDVIARHAPPVAPISYLRKPFSPEQLGAFVRGALEAGGKTVLVVDDEHAIRDFLTTALSHHGYRALGAADGYEALRLASECRVDVLISDVLMPGIEKVIEIAERQPHLQVIAISGGSGPHMDRIATALNAVSTLSKPFQVSVLIEHVRRATAPK
jgi:PAS domain S-box-containing protein